MTNSFCQCGCGAPVARSFRQGHDAKLKSALVARLADSRWWVRESAAWALLERGWGHFVPAEVASSIPVRSSAKGRFVESRHLHRCQVVHTDASDTAHSHRSCPRIEGATTTAPASQGHGWACSACIHTAEFAELVAAATADRFGFVQDDA